MSDTTAESNHTTDAQAKPTSFLSKVNPLNFVATEFSASTGKNKPHPVQAAHQPVFKSEEGKEDFSDVPNFSLKKNENLKIKKEVLHADNITALNNEIDQIQDTCTQIITEIYSHSKKPPTCRTEAEKAVKQLPANITDETRKNVNWLFEGLEKNDYHADHCGLPSFYDDSYGRFIEPKLKLVDPSVYKTLNESLGYFKTQVRRGRDEFDAIKTIHDNEPCVSAAFSDMVENRQFSPEKLRLIASHTLGLMIALERSRVWLNKLNVPAMNMQDYKLDIAVQNKEDEERQARQMELKQQQQQLARAQEAVAARPYTDSLTLLSPYDNLANHVKAVDDQVIKILQEVNPQDLSEIVLSQPQTTPARRSLPMAVLRSLVGMTIPLPLAPIGHVSGPLVYNLGEDPWQPYNEFKVRGDLRQLSEAIKTVKEDLKANNGRIPLFTAEKDSTNEKYSPVLNDSGKPEINAEVKSRLSTFRISATNMFTQPNKTEDELEKMCVVGETVNREQLTKEVNSVYGDKGYQALRKSCGDVLEEVKDVSDKYESIRRGNVVTPY